jgi:predicted CoA-binding protein
VNSAIAKDAYPDSLLRQVLQSVRNIALVGASPQAGSPGQYRHAFPPGPRLPHHSRQPRLSGTELFGEPVHASLAAIGEPIDMVDIFRSAAAVGGVADEAVAIGAKVVWMQLGLRDEATAMGARAVGLIVIMGRCPAIEIPRLFRD